MQVGGDLSVVSEDGKGVKIEVSVPMTAEMLADARRQHDD